MNWILDRAKEPSTWRAIFVLAGLAGYTLSPELQEQIVLAVGACLGVVELIRKEKTNVQPGDAKPAEVNVGEGQGG